jgi:formylglycine-generating enzyme required for sulfatase activity
LKAAGLDVWYDISELVGGESWRIAIQEAIRTSQYVIVVLSPDSIASNWVEEERLFAGKLKRNIIPLFYRYCELPLGYLSLQFIDVRGKNYKLNFDEILQALNTNSVPQSPGFNLAAFLQKFFAKTKIFVQKSFPFLRWIGILGVVVLLLWGGSWVLPKIIAAIPTPKASETQLSVSETPSQTALSNEITDAYGVEMLLVPSGEFVMGNKNGEDDEKPVHDFVLPDFYIDKYEVTNRLYKKCVDAKICAVPKYSGSESHSTYFDNPQFDNYPVIYVDWYMARTYCEWREARLPTEAEWEKAARGTDERSYPWGEGIDLSHVNYLGLRGDTTSVGEYSAGKSLYGTYDMAGNVWEWVSSRYMPYPYRLSDDREIADFPDYRVKRGGSWKSGSLDLRTTNRQSGYPISNSNDTGFRCARDANLSITPTPGMIANQDWKPYMDKNQGSTIIVQPEPGTSNSIRINFNLLQGDWAAVYKKIPPEFLVGTKGLTISYRGHGASNTIEVKLIHTDDTVCRKVIHNKTNTNDIPDSLQIAYSELECESRPLNLDNIDRLDLSFSNWPGDGDEAGEGEVVIEMIQLVP